MARYRSILCRHLPVLSSIVFSYLCNPSAGFRFTLVGLSTDYLRLLFQLHCCLQASSEPNNCMHFYHRSTHWCGQIVTTTADRSVRLWSTPPSRSAPSCWQSRLGRLMAATAFRNFQRPTAKRIFFVLRLSGPQYCTRTVNQHGCEDNGCHAWRCRAEPVCHRLLCCRGMVSPSHADTDASALECPDHHRVPPQNCSPRSARILESP